MGNGILSNKDIEKQIGKNIFIYPYSPNNMSGGSTYNLTASLLAYYKKDTEINGKKYTENIYAVKEKDGKQIISIPGHTTVHIQTDECIYVTKKICGTYHSKVGLVSKGLSHIGTTLDPEYFGTSLISLQNTTAGEVDIEVGKTFVSIMFYKMISPSIPRHDNAPGRSDISRVTEDNLVDDKGNQLSPNIKNRIREWREELSKKNINALKQNCREDFKESIKGKQIRKITKYDFRITLVAAIIILTLAILNFNFKWVQSIDAYNLVIAIIGGIIAFKTYMIGSMRKQIEDE